MRQRARIVDVKDGRISLEMTTHKGCSRCSACGSDRERATVIAVDDVREYRVGEEVTLFVEDRVMLKLYALLYGAPLVAFLAGLAACYAITGEALFSFAAGVLLTAGTYFAVARYIKRTKRFHPVIEKD